MLVLTRRPGEEIVIEGGIRLTVLGVKGNQVRIGITAPASVRVDRQEVHARRFPEVSMRGPSERWEGPAPSPCGAGARRS
jgi:carbon storage regulator